MPQKHLATAYICSALPISIPARARLINNSFLIKNAENKAAPRYFKNSFVLETQCEPHHILGKYSRCTGEISILIIQLLGQSIIEILKIEGVNAWDAYSKASGEDFELSVDKLIV